MDAKTLKRKIQGLKRKLKQTSEMKKEICNDPMNGCPEAFADDFNAEIQGLHTQVQRLHGEYIEKVGYNIPLSDI